LNYELLAPAGDYECFLAAIHAGADAVYLGGNYSARAGARFSDEDILAAIDYAHLFGRKVYMTLNTVMKSSEMEAVEEYLIPFYEAGLDGAIVQDIGLIRFLRVHFPNLQVHASTQMTITDVEGVKLLRELGCSRVVLARELSLSEIQRIHDEEDTELECFIHGALCYSYSGKCLMSSLIGGRSGNRGRCAQPCRLPYNGEYLLSCKDICTLTILPKLMDAGIVSYKIEGRLKNPEYVAGTTGIYRKYMDLYMNHPDQYKVDEKDLDLLLRLYTRSGNSQGYYEQRNGRNMLTIKEPGYARTSEEEAAEARTRFTKDFKLLPVDFYLSLNEGQPAILCATCGEHSVSVEGDLVSAALKKPVSTDDIMKQLRKLGGTQFCLQSAELNLDDNIFLPVSSMNALRRMAIEQLKEDMLSTFRRNYCGQDLPSCSEPMGSLDRPLIHVSVTTPKQALYAAKLQNIDILTVPAYIAYTEMDAIFAAAENNHIKFMLQLPVIARDAYFTRNGEKLQRLLQYEQIVGVLVQNYESLHYLKTIDYQGIIVSDLHLYALSGFACDALHDLGVTRTTTPVELNRKELLRREIWNEDLIVYGRLPAMVSAQCVQKTTDGCMKSSGFCRLNDRQNTDFPVFHNCEECVNLIYNSVPISLHKEYELIQRLHPYSVRLMFTVETEAEMNRIVSIFENFDEDESKVYYNYTKGHIGRGVE